MSFWPSCLCSRTHFPWLPPSLRLPPFCVSNLKLFITFKASWQKTAFTLAAKQRISNQRFPMKCFPDRRRVANRGLRHTANYCRRLKTASVQKQIFDLSGQITVKQQGFFVFCLRKESQTSAAIKVSYLVSTPLAFQNEAAQHLLFFAFCSHTRRSDKLSGCSNDLGAATVTLRKKKKAWQ